MAYPHATPGYIPSPLQSPYLTSPLAHINPAMMSLFPTVTSPTAAAGPHVGGPVVSVAGGHSVESLDTASRSVQMQQAALLQQPTSAMSVHSQFQQQHPAQHLALTTQQHKSKDRVEVGLNLVK